MTEYKCAGMIGEGTYGDVFNYTITDANGVERKVAMKRCLVPKGSKNGIRSIREIDLLIKCRHPNVVAFKRVHKENMLTNVPPPTHTEYQSDHLYLEFELEDRSLIEFTLGKANFDKSTIPSVICDLLLGLEYIHSRGIIHRDIKSPNILLSKVKGAEAASSTAAADQKEKDEASSSSSSAAAADLTILAERYDNYRARICDFGLSRHTSVTGIYTPRSITAQYRPPENDTTNTGGNTGFYTDIWSLGMVLLEMYTNKLIISADTEEQYAKEYDRIRNGPSAFDRRIRTLLEPFANPDLIFFAKKCLAVQPGNRASATDLLNTSYIRNFPGNIEKIERTRKEKSPSNPMHPVLFYANPGPCRKRMIDALLVAYERSQQIPWLKPQMLFMTIDMWDIYEYKEGHVTDNYFDAIFITIFYISVKYFSTLGDPPGIENFVSQLYDVDCLKIKVVVDEDFCKFVNELDMMILYKILSFNVYRSNMYDNISVASYRFIGRDSIRKFLLKYSANITSSVEGLPFEDYVRSILEK